MDQLSVDGENTDGGIHRQFLLLVRQLWQIVGSGASRFRDRSDPFIRFLAVGLLLSAAALKYLYLTTTPLLVDDSEWQRWAWIAQIELEIFWGIWLLAKIYSRFTRIASALLFVMFAVFSAYSGLMGHESCGCFGVVRVNPWVSFALDVVFAGAFLSIRAPEVTAVEISGLPLLRLAAVLIASALLGIPIALFSYGPTLATVSEDGEISGEEQVVLLDPQQWIGKRFPLTKQIDIGQSFTRGHWRLLFVRPGCPYCEDALRQLLSDPLLKAKDDDAHWALVELPLLAENVSTLDLPASADLLLGRLDKGRSWIANVPFTVTLVDGIVAEWTPGVLSGT